MAYDLVIRKAQLRGRRDLADIAIEKGVIQKIAPQITGKAGKIPLHFPDACAKIMNISECMTFPLPERFLKSLKGSIDLCLLHNWF